MLYPCKSYITIQRKIPKSEENITIKKKKKENITIKKKKISIKKSEYY
jgi:hypothetical protein